MNEARRGHSRSATAVAQHLRALRENHWPDRKITQPELAEALGVIPADLVLGVADQAAHSAAVQIEAYAAVFASGRCFDSDPARAISPHDLNDEERQVMNDLRQE